MIGILIPTLLLFIFSVINLVGISKDLLIIYLLHFLGAIIIFAAFKIIKIKFFRRNANFFYWFWIFFLLITYIIGFEAKGSKRWIDLYFFSFQPSEFFKIFFVIFLADFYAKSRRFANDLTVFLKAFIYFVIPTFIIFKQPDLGSAMVYTTIFVVMTLFSGLPKKYLLYLAVIVIICMPIGWRFLHDYQQARLVAFVNPSVNQDSTAYNMTQAIITSGSGQLAGRGLGMGKQSQLYFLPEYHTDFAYSSLVEQFGFIGGAIVILLYIVLAIFLLIRIFQMYYSSDEKNKFQLLYTVGFFGFIVFQVFVNIGMNIGIMPIAGITLPLISYGGSSLITYFLGLALLL